MIIGLNTRKFVLSIKSKNDPPFFMGGGKGEKGGQSLKCGCQTYFSQIFNEIFNGKKLKYFRN